MVTDLGSAAAGLASRYVIMAASGFLDPLLTQFVETVRPIRVAARRRATSHPKMRIIESIHENGPKLVEMPEEGELSLRLSVPGVMVVREVFYKRAWYRPGLEGSPVRRASARAPVRPPEITVTDRASGGPLQGAYIVAYTDFAARVGVEAETGRNGRARLAGIASRQRLERVYVYGPPGYWGRYAVNTSAAAMATVELGAVDRDAPNLLLHQLYGGLPGDAGAGTTIGIIDTGVDGGHPALANVAGGLNCVGNEVRADPAAEANWRPALIDGEHGTHVAGIAAAQSVGGAFRGVAPGATLRAYRVFPDNGGDASNFDIAKAIDAAVADRCDIVNLSLGGARPDPLTRAAIDRAIAAGVVAVVAAGNDERQPVSYPAAFPASVAVSAMGRRGSFPASSTGKGDIARPFGGPSNRDFVAAFSNFGQEIDVTGPGVEIVSTLPGGIYGCMSGTSMASPAVAGFAAYLLAGDPALRQSVGADRSRRLKDDLYSKCRPAGFGRDFEGFGLPQP